METGDPLIDKWEKEIALGADSDLTEGLPVSEKEKHFKAVKSTVEKITNIGMNTDDDDDDFLKSVLAEKEEFSDFYP